MECWIGNYKIHTEGQYAIVVKSLVSDSRKNLAKSWFRSVLALNLCNVFNLCPNLSIYKMKMLILATPQEDRENELANVKHSE